MYIYIGQVTFFFSCVLLFMVMSIFIIFLVSMQRMGFGRL